MRVHITVTDDKGNSYDGTIDLTRIATKTDTRAKKSPYHKPAHSEKPTGPASAIRELYKQGHFKIEKSLADVKMALKKMGLNYSGEAVQMALNRAKYLARSGTIGNYRYIQKYPPS